jgi:hypothetical protein
MRVDLVSKQADGTPHWVEFRDQLMALDKFEVDEAATVTVGDGANKVSMLAMQNDMRNALLGRIITAWSFPAPIPSANGFQAADKAIGSVLSLKDYRELVKAVKPLMDDISDQEDSDPKKTPDS